jgi:Tetracyclin repressor-like, C-terminal domain
VFPGGCFLTAAAAEYDGRPGPVREAIEGALALWASVLEADAATAIEAGDLPPDADPAQIAFELSSIAMGVNQARQLRCDPEAIARGRRAMNRVLNRRQPTPTRRKRSG